VRFLVLIVTLICNVTKYDIRMPFFIGVMPEQKADWNRNQKLQQGGHEPGKTWKPGTDPNFRPKSIVAKLLPIWAAAEHLFITMPGDWLGRLCPKW